MTQRDPYARFLLELKKKRKARKMTQADVAKAIKLSRAQYTAIEMGRSMVSWKHLHALAKALGTSFRIHA